METAPHRTVLLFAAFVLTFTFLLTQCGDNTTTTTITKTARSLATSTTTTTEPRPTPTTTPAPAPAPAAYDDNDIAPPELTIDVCDSLQDLGTDPATNTLAGADLQDETVLSGIFGTCPTRFREWLSRLVAIEQQWK